MKVFYYTLYHKLFLYCHPAYLPAAILPSCRPAAVVSLVVVCHSSVYYAKPSTIFIILSNLLLLLIPKYIYISVIPCYLHVLFFIHFLVLLLFFVINFLVFFLYLCLFIGDISFLPSFIHSIIRILLHPCSSSFICLSYPCLLSARSSFSLPPLLLLHLSLLLLIPLRFAVFVFFLLSLCLSSSTSAS